MNDSLHKRLILVGATSFSLAMPACDLDDKNIGETGDTSGDGDGDGTSDDGDPLPGDGDGDGDGDGKCAYPDVPVEIRYGPFDFGLNAPFEGSIDWTCTVTSVDPDDGLSLALDCSESETPVQIDVSAEPGFSLSVAVDDTLRVRYVQEMPFWTDTYLRIDLEGYGHLLTLIDADTLLPAQPGSFELPFDVSAEVAACSPIESDCGTIDRLALSFEINGDPVQVLDAGHVDVEGNAQLWAQAAQTYQDNPFPVCSDLPANRYELLIVDAGQE